MSNALIPSDPDQLYTLIHMWADSRVGNTDRRQELIASKTLGVSTYLNSYHAYTPITIKVYTAALRNEGYADSTIYAKISQISSFFRWLAKAGYQVDNPVTEAVRPDAPKPYQSESTKPLTDQQLVILTDYLAELSSGPGDCETDRYHTALANKRDYALLLWYIVTGKRLSEILQLKHGNVAWEAERVTFEAKHKGGIYKSSRITELVAIDAYRDYAAACYIDTAKKDDPLWLSHSRTAMHIWKPGADYRRVDGRREGLTRAGFHKSFKLHCQAAGLGDVHIHQLRHTFARILGDIEGVNMGVVQAALGHSRQETTRVYLQRIGVTPDHSQTIGDRLFRRK